MSASLVGSEMCIRDRTTFCTFNECRRYSVRSVRFAARLDRYSVYVSSSCLLYTSDAADDM
eukprot:13465221-Alexandrium_andersonii.AAC.1